MENEEHRIKLARCSGGRVIIDFLKKKERGKWCLLKP